MRRILGFAGTLAGLAALGQFAALAGSSTSVSPTFTVDLAMGCTVAGRVLNAANRQALSGASVSLAGVNGTTGADGKFTLASVSLASGNALSASKTGFVPYSAPVAAPPGAALVSVPDILLQAGSSPIVSRVPASRDGIFLAGVSIQNTYTATVNWNGTTPGTVRFLANGALVREFTGAGPDYACEVDMAAVFRPSYQADGNRLEVVATSSEGASSPSTGRNVTVLPLPSALATLALVADPSGDDIDINADFSFPEPGFEYVLDLPVIGKFGVAIAANASFDYTVKDGDWEAAFGVGAESKEGKRGRRPTIPGLARSPKMKLYLGNKEVSGKLVAGACGTAKVGEGIRFEEVFGHGEIEAKLELGRVGLPDLLGPGLSTGLGKIPGLSEALKTVTVIIYVIPGLEGEAVFALQPRFEFSRVELTGKVGLEAAYEPNLGVVKMRFYVGGEPSATFQLPPPILKQLRFRAYAGAELEWKILTFKVEYVFVDRTVSSMQGQQILMSGADGPRAVSLLPGAGARDWQPVSRPHLLAGPEVFVAGADATARAMSKSTAPSQLDTFRSMGLAPVRGAVGLGTAALAPWGSMPGVSAAQADVALVTNVYSSGEPAMAGRSSDLMLLYVADNGSSNAMQFTDIRWTRWDGANWSAPQTVQTNTQAEFAPQVAFDGNGDALALWERVADPNFTNTDLTAMAAQLEIVWSRWDRASGVWTAPQALTANAVLDQEPLLCGPMGDGSLLAVWTRNDANLPMGTNGAGSRVLWTRWDPAGRTWAAPQTLVADLPNRLSQSLAGASNRAVYAWSRDLDGVLTNETDQQVFRCEWNGAGWGAATPCTTNDLGNRNVRVAVSATGEVFAVWQQGPDLVMSRNFSTNVTPVRLDAQTAGFADYAMSFGPAGNLVLLWQEMTEAGSDGHYVVFDPVSGTWGRDERLFTDEPLERSFAPVWDAVGNLTVAYDKVQIVKESKTVAVEGGGDVTVANVPQPGRVDLCVTKRALIRDLALRPGDFTADGGNFLPGDAVTLSAVVRNAGDVAVSNAVVEFFDGDPAAGGLLVTNVAIAGWLEGAATNVASTLWVVPEPATNHALFAVVNRTSTASEFDPSNNVQSLAVGGTDLIVSLVEYAAETNGALRVIAQVRNGGAPGATNSVLAIRRTDGTGTNAPGPVLATAAVPALEPGRLAQVALELPAGTQPDGTAFYLLRADEARATGDVDTNNNAATFAVSMTIDSDGDGMPDAYENQRAFLSALSAADAAADWDRDGVSNLAEYRAGTDPGDPASYLAMTPLPPRAASGGGLQVVWGAISNRLYSVERSTNLVQGLFKVVSEHVLSTPPQNSFTDPDATNAAPYFYRVRVE